MVEKNTILEHRCREGNEQRRNPLINLDSHLRNFLSHFSREVKTSPLFFLSDISLCMVYKESLQKTSNLFVFITPLALPSGAGMQSAFKSGQTLAFKPCSL